jgi:hypothetical protein
MALTPVILETCVRALETRGPSRTGMPARPYTQDAWQLGALPAGRQDTVRSGALPVGPEPRDM